jgi:hypothetical protein
MKRIFTLITVIAFYSANVFAQNSQSAVEYLNLLGNEFKQIQTASLDYTKAAANNKSARKINKRRLELIQQIDASTQKVKSMSAYDKQTYLKDSVLSFMRIQKIVISEDYAKIMDLEDVAESSYDAMEAYFKARDIASVKLSECFERTSEAYKRFAKENNIILTEGEDDKVSQQLKIADEVYDYYNPMYLLFFKAYKQELYFMSALQTGDIASMEQNKVSLSKVVSDCQATLKTMKAFRGTDNTLIVAASDLFAFYKSEADVKFQKLLDFYVKKEAFEKAKKAFEANKNKSNDDINNYNKMINEINQASAEFNAVNNELNNKRSQLINAWNKAANNFTAKYL